VTPLKAIDRFTSLTIIGMMKIMCNTDSQHLKDRATYVRRNLNCLTVPTANRRALNSWPCFPIKAEAISNHQQLLQ
jgi:hypothetical protein